MNQPVPTGPDLFAMADDFYNKAKAEPGYGSAKQAYFFQAANFRAQQANTAALVMLAECVTTVDHFDFDGWREKIGLTWLKKCRGEDVRRPQCTPTHSEDCAFADPVPEPKHVLLPVGTRVLVSERATKYPDGRIVYDKQPKVAKIVGYDMHKSKYQLNDEMINGGYYDFVTWAFADNRVQPHPEQDTAVPALTGPRIYVQDRRSKQGYVVEVYHHEKDDTLWYTVQFFSPGATPVKKNADSLTVIAESQVVRCPFGQTRDECGSGENQCELCLTAEDQEADEIEESMGLR